MAVLKKWYINQANDIFSQRLKKYEPMFDESDIPMTVEMSPKFWGKFHPIKRIMVLNVELVAAPTDCIDYVIVHELCHGKIVEHGEEFDALITSKMPDWKKWHTQLGKFSDELSSLFIY